MQNPNPHQKEITVSDRLLGRYLPNWLRIFYFANLVFFVFLIGVAIFSPNSLNIADSLFLSLYLIVWALILGKYGSKNRPLTPKETSEF